MKKTVKIQSWLFTKSDSKFQIAEKYGYAPNRFSYLYLRTVILFFRKNRQALLDACRFFAIICSKVVIIFSKQLFTACKIVYNHGERRRKGAYNAQNEPKRQFLCLPCVNMPLNLEGLIPAVVLLVLHYVLGWPLWPTFAAVGLLVLYLIAWMAVIGRAGRCGSTPDAPKENKNPYSNKHI